MTQMTINTGMTPCYIIVSSNNGKLYIKDTGGMSITNAAEHVCEALYQKYGAGMRIVHTDTDGEMCELLHEDGVFIDWAEWGEDDPSN